MQWDNPSELTEEQLEALADAIDIINMARRIARRYGLDGMSDIDILEFELKVTHEMGERRQARVTREYWNALLD